MSKHPEEEAASKPRDLSRYPPPTHHASEISQPASGAKYLFVAAAIASLIGLVGFGIGLDAGFSSEGGGDCFGGFIVGALAIVLGGLLAAVGVGMVWVRRRRTRGARRGLVDYVVVPTVSLIIGVSGAAAVLVLVSLIVGAVASLDDDFCYYT